MVEDRSMTSQVEVRVICQIQYRHFVRYRPVVDSQFVYVSQKIRDRNVQISRVSFFAIFA